VGVRWRVPVSAHLLTYGANGFRHGDTEERRRRLQERLRGMKARLRLTGLQTAIGLMPDQNKRH
jgi:hypothetical protein